MVLKRSLVHFTRSQSSTEYEEYAASLQRTKCDLMKQTMCGDQNKIQESTLQGNAKTKQETSLTKNTQGHGSWMDMRCDGRRTKANGMSGIQDVNCP